MTIAQQLELSTRTTNLLDEHSVYTVDDFMALDRTIVLRWKNAGRKTWNEIQEAQHSLRFVDRQNTVENLVRLCRRWNELIVHLHEHPHLGSDYTFNMDQSGRLNCWRKVKTDAI